MLQVTPQHRLLLAVEPIDFRAGIDRLKSICRQHLLCDPFSGTIFAFANRARTSVKLFSQGKLAWWPKDNSNTVSLRASEFQILMAQGDPMKAAIPEDWRPLQIGHAASAKTDGKLS